MSIDRHRAIRAERNLDSSEPGKGAGDRGEKLWVDAKRTRSSAIVLTAP